MVFLTNNESQQQILRVLVDSFMFTMFILLLVLPFTSLGLQGFSSEQQSNNVLGETHSTEVVEDSETKNSAVESIEIPEVSQTTQTTATF